MLLLMISKIFSVLKYSQLDLKESYLAYHRSRAVDRDDEARIGCFPYVPSTGSMLGIPTSKVRTVKLTASDIQLNKSA